MKDCRDEANNSLSLHAVWIVSKETRRQINSTDEDVVFV